ncbi:uncharacterized protein LOC116293428 [Actinia tenebrosa]|uniref:Uncharacterized protein LOC116293428 n=1 Tax=Actinia tenebrosa TaxID=6105 RepID=A0A6P8HNU1_ACTTE|nr:uncharacterized protein LOC116293428 [Actinia tenebrosa]
MTKLASALYFIAVVCMGLHTAQALQCYQCDSDIALVNCTKVQKVVTCDSNVHECCTVTETGKFISGLKYKYFEKGCKGRKHKTPDNLFSHSVSTQCRGQSLRNASQISQASFVLVFCLILVSKMIAT